MIKRKSKQAEVRRSCLPPQKYFQKDFFKENKKLHKNDDEKKEQVGRGVGQDVFVPSSEIFPKRLLFNSV